MRLGRQIKWVVCLIVAAVVCSQAAVFGQNFTFTANSYSVDGSPLDVIPVCITNNSLPDLVTADGDAYTSGLTNNGSGDFGFDESFAPYISPGGDEGSFNAPQPTGVIAAYVDGPGASNVCLLVMDTGEWITEYPALEIWANAGTGFPGNGGLPNAVANVTVGDGWLYSAATANISNTNKPDVICTCDETDLALMTNNNKGSFDVDTTIPVGPDPLDVIAADLNSNGTIDVVSANSGGNSLTVTPITRGQPPAIGASFTLTVGSSPESVVAADLRGIGKLDLVSANYGSDSLTIYTNNGSGGFGSNATLNVGSAAQSVTAVDLNGDGRPDLVCGNPNGLTIFVNNGSGIFTSNVTLNVSGSVGDVISTDVNGDGKPDLVCLGGQGVAVLINTTAPWVNIATTNNLVALNWPNWATNYFLESTTNLNAPNWTPVSNAVPAAGTVTLTNSWPAAYFRLQGF